MSRKNRRGVGLTLIWALVGVLMAFSIFYVAWNVYDAIYASTSGMKESTLCSLVLGIKQGGTTSTEDKTWFRTAFEKTAGYVVPTRGICGKDVVVTPDPKRPGTPRATDVNTVLDRLADEINRCWERSRRAQSVEFTCVHTFKFRLESGAISESAVTKHICYDSAADEYTKWKNEGQPGNTIGGGGFTCPPNYSGPDRASLDNLYGPDYIGDTAIHAYRIYYCGNNEDDHDDGCKNAVKVKKEY